MSYNSNRDSYRERDRDRDRFYRPDIRNDRRDRESDLEDERSDRLVSSMRKQIEPITLLSGIVAGENSASCKQVADVMRSILRLQIKRTPIQDRKKTQEKNIARLKQEVKQLEDELKKIDEEVIKMCNSFAASLLESLPELHKQDNALAISKLEDLSGNMKDEIGATLEAQTFAIETRVQQRLKDELNAYKMEFKDNIKAQQAELDTQYQQKLEQSINVHRAELEDSLRAYKAELDKKFRRRHEKYLRALRDEIAGQLEGKFEQKLKAYQEDMEKQYRKAPEQEPQALAAEILDQISKANKRMKSVEEENNDLLEKFEPAINRIDSLHTRLQVLESSNATPHHETISTQPEQINSILRMLRSCEKGVEPMLTGVCNRFGTALDKANSRIAALERVSGRATKICSQKVDPDYQTFVKNADEQYSSFTQGIHSRHENFEKAIGEKHANLAKAVEDQYLGLITTMEENFDNLSNLCWGLDAQYRHLNSKELFQRIIAEATNMLPNSVGTLSTEVNRLNVRLGSIEQQLVNQHPQPVQRERKRQKTTEE